MAANKNIRIGPVALTTTSTTKHLLNPQTLTGGVSAGGTSNTQTYIPIRRYPHQTKLPAATFSLWIGATGANAAGKFILDRATTLQQLRRLVWRFAS